MTTLSLPILTEVWGARWLQRNREWLDPLIQSHLPWFSQLESDLQGLETYVGLSEIVRCYRSALRNRPQIQEAIYEVHGCHLMACVAGNIRLHVPLDNEQRGNFDFQVNVLGECLSGDVKTRKDDFPFNLPPTQVENGMKIFSGSRGGLDPHDADRLGISMKPKTGDTTHVDIPESTVIKQLLEEALGQLPLSGKTLVIIGQIMGDEYDLEDALGGTLTTGIRKDTQTGEIIMEDFRRPTGIFCGLPEYEQFNRLGGVLWTKLSSPIGQFERDYRLYPNSFAQEPIPEAISDSIVEKFREWRTPQGDSNEI